VNFLVPCTLDALVPWMLFLFLILLERSWSARFGNEFPSVQDFMTEAHILKYQLQLAMTAPFFPDRLQGSIYSRIVEWLMRARCHGSRRPPRCGLQYDQGGESDTSVPRITLG
jgi:hypothetical protein